MSILEQVTPGTLFHLGANAFLDLREKVVRQADDAFQMFLFLSLSGDGLALSLIYWTDCQPDHESARHTS
jgi:hypothetical protein